ncbi:MAG: retroviral-like aspartic protease family protein, partial [Cohaesibacter sp.]|nr:retroviral-like aspartic protease family protein [Cohaesibacter sp.]
NITKLQKKKEGDGWNTMEEKGDKKEQNSGGRVTAEECQQNKSIRTIEDGLLLVVPTKIYGKEVKTLIDSGATRCFVTPSCITKVGLKGCRDLGSVQDI